MSDNEHRALARLVEELHRRTEGERARLLEGCRRDLERERQLLEGLESPEGRHQETLDAIASADRGEGASQEEVERALATPMRIQDLVRDAQPHEWQAMGAGGFIATPTPDSTLIVDRRSSGDWHWSVHIDELDVSTVGTATSPARAVAAAEAVYHLTGQR